MIKSQSWEQHTEGIGTVLGRLQEMGLRLRVKKCKLGRTEIAMLIHLVCKNRARADPDKVCAIISSSSLRTETELRSFLGTASYSRRLIGGLPHVLAPLF